MLASLMAKQCTLTGKKPLVGHKVSHSNIKTKMRQEPNLRKKRIFDEEKGCWVTLRVSASALRTITKHGLAKATKKLSAQKAASNKPVSKKR